MAAREKGLHSAAIKRVGRKLQEEAPSAAAAEGVKVKLLSSVYAAGNGQIAACLP